MAVERGPGWVVAAVLLLRAEVLAAEVVAALLLLAGILAAGVVVAAVRLLAGILAAEVVAAVRLLRAAIPGAGEAEPADVKSKFVLPSNSPARLIPPGFFSR